MLHSASGWQQCFRLSVTPFDVKLQRPVTKGKCHRQELQSPLKQELGDVPAAWMELPSPRDTSPALEEGNVYGRGVEIDKLEDENFEGESIFELGLGPVHLCDKANTHRAAVRHPHCCNTQIGQECFPAVH